MMARRVDRVALRDIYHAINMNLYGAFKAWLEDDWRSAIVRQERARSLYDEALDEDERDEYCKRYPRRCSVGLDMDVDLWTEELAFPMF